MAPAVQLVSGQRLLSHLDGVRAVYTDAFCAPPWNEDAGQADIYLQRLVSDVDRDGFTAALALDGDTVLGWATAWTTPAPFPDERSYPQIAAALGQRRTQAWLCDAREIDELAVAASARRTGLGGRLLRAVTSGRTDGRCWLITSVQAGQTVAFYERAGWLQVTHPAPTGKGYVALLGPRHPAQALAPRPL
ncbi:GNAT family N-acetyltransferase [Streptomyces boninensis]|uniref:GNAT family N-acetyltransferase n=1 Tax=Streptomyces boninensis TaxID=2039455 RepID=UPI003B21DA60